MASRRRFTAAQRAAQRRFAEMARRRARSRRRPTRTRRRRRTTTTPAQEGAQIVARRRRTRRRPVSRRFTRRRSGGAAVPTSIRGFASPKMLTTIAGTAAGIVAADRIVDRIPVDALATGRGRILGKALVGVLAGVALRPVHPDLAMGLATGAMASAAVDAYNEFAGGGISGMGYLINSGTGPQYLLSGGMSGPGTTATGPQTPVMAYHSAGSGAF